MVDLTPYKKQIEEARNSSYESYVDPRSAFINELQAAGFEVPKIIQLEKVVRINDPFDKKKTERTGWYFYTEIPDAYDAGKVFAIATYGSWRGAPEKITWKSKQEQAMTFRERAEYSATIERIRKKQEEERKLIQGEAANKAADIIANAGNPNNANQYLTRKGVKAFAGVKESSGDLIIPMVADGKVQSLQFIKPDGFKKFLTGGRVKGCYFKITGNEDTVYVAEGYSTGASVAEATGCSVYVAFNAGNLYEVASTVKAMHPTSRIVIAGDDDRFKEVNAGRTKATQASEGLGIEAIFPEFSNLESEPVDFNDLHALEGLEVIKEFLTKKPIKAFENKKEENEHLQPPAGFLQDVYNFYNATSGNKQPGFAVQTALALGSILCGRSYKTNMENFSSLYLLNVGKSSTGKEHSKTVIEQILSESNQGNLIAGDGYTSAGGVFSALLDKPKHISIIDEFGRYLEASGSKGNHHQKEANTKLMESIGRCHGFIRPPSYSTMTLKKKDADSVKDRKVRNPGITLVTMTTPVTLFQSLDMGAIKDGFINRFIISISDAERAIRVHKPPIEVPHSIINWIDTIMLRGDNTHTAVDEVNFTTLNFSDEAFKMQIEFQHYCIDKANQLEKHGMAELSGRANEMAMRVSLITALARDPMTEVITKEDMAWSISYIKACFEKTMSCLKMSISASSFEGEKKEILQALRDRSPEYIRLSHMRKQIPFSKHKKKDLQEILDSLQEAELIDSRPSRNGGAGRPTIEYVAI